MIGHHQSESWEISHAFPSNLESDVEKTESHESHRICVLLIMRIQERDEYSKEFLYRCESERNDIDVEILYSKPMRVRVLVYDNESGKQRYTSRGDLFSFLFQSLDYSIV